MKKLILTLLIIVAAGAAVWLYTKPKMEGQAAAGAPLGPKAIPVRGATVETQAMPYVLDAVATVEAEQSVAIRAEVSGVLQKITFREGDIVKAGQVLFQIDGGSQQAEVDKARANLARDQAALTEASAQARRLESLVAKEYVTQQEYAQAAAQEQAALATVHANQAALKSMQLQFGNTRITSPISGRAGIVNVKQGNLVSAASTTPLVTINATQTVMANFTVPQQQLQAIREGQRKHPMAVEVRHDAKDAVIATGTLAFIDNAVDTQTGTLRMKARIANKDEVLWPGELVTLRMVLDVQQDALVIPETAIQPSQSGAFVYVMAEGKAQAQPITVARQVGAQVVVTNGLTAGQQVILNPPKNLRAGGAVELMGAKKENKERKPNIDAASGVKQP
ncbi:MAG: efflux RND transporter periplasmic adaptor subunit [Sideroxydans sp.]|nr:efflux RND transporter periplasmic adaptor subunit [Sideroxydans sp.]